MNVIDPRNADIQVYVNGQLKDTTVFPQVAVTDTLELCAHTPRIWDFPYWADAIMDDLRIYSRALSEQEVLALYTQPPVADAGPD